MKREIIKIDGMTCHSCEEILESNIKNIDGVKKVKATIATKSLEISYNEKKFDRNKMIETIEKAGYSIKSDSDKNFYIGVIVFLIIGYLFIKNIGGFDYIPDVNQSMGYSLLFIVGILTSLHCIAMCGGINVSVCLSGGACEKSKFKPGLLYNLGRVTSYTIIGGIVGGIGGLISVSTGTTNIVSVIAGLFMIMLGINMLGIFKRINLSLPIPNFIKKSFNNKKKKYTSPYVIGLLNGFMPCGPLQTMQIYALGTGSIIAGALSMFAFSIGTVPLMLTVSFISGILSGKIGVRFKKISAILIIILGLGMFNRGVDLGALFAFEPDSLRDKDVVYAEIKEGYQEVVTRFENGRYQAIVVQRDIPVRWVIIAEPGDLNGCNNPVMSRTFDFKKTLEIGENVIEFLPEEDGSFRYSCWMYMIFSNIYVVEDMENI